MSLWEWLVVNRTHHRHHCRLEGSPPPRPLAQAGCIKASGIPHRRRCVRACLVLASALPPACPPPAAPGPCHGCKHVRASLPAAAAIPQGLPGAFARRPGHVCRGVADSRLQAQRVGRQRRLVGGARALGAGDGVAGIGCRCGAQHPVICHATAVRSVVVRVLVSAFIHRHIRAGWPITAMRARADATRCHLGAGPTLAAAEASSASRAARSATSSISRACLRATAIGRASAAPRRRRRARWRRARRGLRGTTSTNTATGWSSSSKGRPDDGCWAAASYRRAPASKSL
jgi:hypothetical protein